MSADENKKIALRHAQAGLKVFPCRLQSRRPCVSDWATVASSDLDQIESWWKQFPGALPALPMKPNDLIAIDCDNNHAPGQNGTEAFESLFNDLPLHPIISTPRGGQHHFFRQRENEKLGNSRGRLPDGIDVRGFQPDNDGGYVIAPGPILPRNYTYPDGQILPDGAQYRLADGAPSFVNSFLNKEIPQLPDCIADLLREPVYEKPAQQSSQPPIQSTPGFREQRYAEVALENVCKHVATTAKGNRNNKLNAATLTMGHMIGAGWIGRFIVETELLDAAKSSGLLKEEGRASSLATIHSGIEAGMKEPHAPLPDRRVNGGSHSTHQINEPVAADDFILTPEQWPDPIGPDAHIGLVGDFVRTIEPHTEADSNGLLVQVLTNFGNAIGHTAYFQFESTRHYCNLFQLMVGESSKSRKGTSAARIYATMRLADDTWARERKVSGLSSGEGLIHAVRDRIIKVNKDGQAEVIDEGVTDKRLFVTEEEFGSTLTVLERTGNTLSPVLRASWDGLKLQTLTRGAPAKATDPHISIVGQITKDELMMKLTKTEAGNGFANRFLFTLVRRSKLLPLGGNLTETALGMMAEDLAQAIGFARSRGRVYRTPAAEALWLQIYEQLSAGAPGLFGSVTGRAEAQVVRLSLIYALLDKSNAVDVSHLRAVLAVWKYCSESARIIFGDRIGEMVADTILDGLRQAPSGLTKTDISNLFARNKSSQTLQMAMGVLLRGGKVRSEETTKGGGLRWFAT